MAWHEGTMTRAVGELKAILDAKLPLNAYWHIEDAAAGANIGVYHNLDAARNSNFILVVKDNQINFATVELWQGWDSVTHVGTGQSLTLASGGVTTLYIVKSLAGYALRVKDHNFIFCDMNRYFANYIGQLKRYDESKNMPILICHNSFSAAPVRNPLGSRNYDIGSTASSSWRCLFDEAGNVRTVFPKADELPTSESSVTASDGIVIRTIGGTILIEETPVFNFTTGLLLGALDGVCYTGITTDAMSLPNMDTVTISGVVWVMIKGGTYGSLVEKV